MEVQFRNAVLERLESDAKFSGGYSPALVRTFRMRMQLIRAAEDERALYALKSLHFEKLKGNRSDQRSLRLNDQWRLILEFEQSEKEKVIYVVSIEDYH
jgi:toxin HigB-1